MLMKRYIIGALIGAILVFGWQAVAHMFMHHHDEAFKKAPNQESLITTLSGTIKEEGQYLIPTTDVKASEEEKQQYTELMKGKPWALVTYHPSLENDMGIAVLRSFSTAFLSVLLLIFLLGRNPGNFGTIFLKGLAAASLMFIYVYYNKSIWIHTPWSALRPELIDLLMSWSLCSLWLGWWLNKKSNHVRNGSSA